MDIAEILELANNLIFSKTGKHLDRLQKTVLKGTIQGQTYSEIAKDNGFSESHVKNVGHELWNLLSSVLGEKVTKANFKSIFKNIRSKNFSQIDSKGCQNNPTINNINIFTDKHRSSSSPQNPQKTPTQPHIDLGDAPEIFSFYDRTTELATLVNWIICDRTRLIALLGISGIGKTTLSLRLIEQIKTNFDYIIYRSLRFSPTLNATLTNLLQIFPHEADIPQNIETQISQLLNYLRQHRCLIIFDDLQMLFASGQLAGQYQTGYEDYQLFFKLIAEVNHNSCLLLNSWEKPREIAKLEKANNYVRTFVLGSLGLAAKEILKERKLSDEETWETLIDIYQGNPLWLELTASAIEEIFAGSVSDFLQCDAPILDESLQAQLDQQFQRLTQQEIAVITQLAKESQPVVLPDILKIGELSVSDLVNVMRSLGRRLLIEGKEEGKTTFFSLNSVIKEYVKTRYMR
ncbi:AAA family ATPase [Planktothrix sp. FACHB-1355]|uniref:AAA family ATPase n=1 Tax=Aerosakkonema funiforme FACHB-1375 TaxID=2949571 RepID=A0A926ZJ86_9CYAN|nr:MULTISPECIES: AAA family ATPase [Oscillatoriales]MBD2184760.1 AAA family ATPase [Aerosakkonema funiforme FACHB-1375]MBD3559071.1 AAA family ATPase [Planktothrix sp. FACHB-1355]